MPHNFLSLLLEFLTVPHLITLLELDTLVESQLYFFSEKYFFVISRQNLAQRNNYFFFLTLGTFEALSEIMHPIDIAFFLHFQPTVVSTIFSFSFLFVQSFLSQGNNFVDFFIRSECFFITFLTVLKSQIKKFKHYTGDTLHTHF